MSAPVEKYHHPIGKRQDWETPDHFFDALHREFRFSLDAAASPHNFKCKRYYTPEQDGLAQDWSGETVWLNPPYGKQIASWAKKAHESARRGATVVMLVPARTDSAWWHDYVEKATERRFLRGRLRFVGAPYNAPFPCAVVVFRPPPTDREGAVSAPPPTIAPTTTE